MCFLMIHKSADNVYMRLAFNAVHGRNSDHAQHLSLATLDCAVNAICGTDYAHNLMLASKLQARQHYCGMSAKDWQIHHS